MKSDAELMAEFRRGNRRSLHMLMRRYHVRLLNFIYPLVGNGALAEELTQRSFLRLSIDLEARTSTPSSRFSTLLFRTGYICWLDHLRQASSQTHALPYVVSHVASPPSGEPLTRQTVNGPIASDAPPEGIAIFLGALPNELRAVVVLREVCGLSYSDIAAVFNVSQNSVKHRIHDAFGQLLAAMQEKAALPPAPPASPAADAPTQGSTGPAAPNVESNDGGGHTTGETP